MSVVVEAGEVEAVEVEVQGDAEVVAGDIEPDIVAVVPQVENPVAAIFPQVNGVRSCSEGGRPPVTEADRF